MKLMSEEFLERAISAMTAGIEIYNKPGFHYRAESFAILAINGWELLLKAKWLHENQNQVESLYVTDNKGNVKKTRSNAPSTRNLDYIAKKFVDSKTLDRAAWNNIQALQEIRDSSIHFFNKSSVYDKIYSIGAACVKNFVIAVHSWFNKDLSGIDIPLMPLTFFDLPQGSDGIMLSTAEENLLSFLEQLAISGENDDSPYAVMVNFDIKLTKSNSDKSFVARITTDPSALPIQLTEEQVRETYPWDYHELTKRCKERYNEEFKVNSQYHDVRKPLEEDPKFAKMRFLDPGNNKSSKKTFYNPNILKEFDKHYTRNS